MKHKLFISCEEAAHHIDKAQYGEASFYDSLTYKIHTFYCKHCKNYELKNKVLTQLLKKYSIRTLSQSQKQKMKETMALENIDT